MCDDCKLMEDRFIAFCEGLEMGAIDNFIKSDPQLCRDIGIRVAEIMQDVQLELQQCQQKLTDK